MKQFFQLSIHTFIFVFIFSCNQQSAENQLKIAPDSTLAISYADGFSIEYFSAYTRVSVYSPWQGAENKEFAYYLAENLDSIPSFVPEKNRIHIPLSRIVVMSSSHVAMLDFIDESDKIVGVSGAKFLFNPKLQDRFKNGQIKDVGFDQAIDYETIISLTPDLVMVYGIGGEINTMVNKLIDLGVKVVYNADYLENNPLGKLEWSKFISVFFRKEALAQRKFAEIESDYNEVKNNMLSIDKKPSILALKAESYFRLKKYSNALRVLNLAIYKFSNE